MGRGTRQVACSASAVSRTGSKAAGATVGLALAVLVLIAVLADALGWERGALRSRGASEDARSASAERRGPRLAGRQGSVPEPVEAPAKPPPPPRIQGRVVCTQTDGSSSPADAAVVLSFQAYRHRMGYTTTWIATRETVPTDEGGTFDVGLPDSSESIRTVFLSVDPPHGWIEPAHFKLERGRVFVSVEIPARIHDHRSWVSVPPPEGQWPWPRDASGYWAVPEIHLVRAATVSGTALDPWGARLTGALVACLWPHRDLGLTRRLALTDGEGRFAFEVPADGREIRLELILRPTWEDTQALRSPPAPRTAPFDPAPPGVEEACAEPPALKPPAPMRRPWPGTPAAVVQPGARGVVLQARVEALVEGRIVAADGAPLGAGEIYVRPLDPTVWPVGYDHAAERSYQAELREDGTFTLGGLSAGSWIVAFREPVETEYRRIEPPPRIGHVVVEAPSSGATIVCRPAVWIRVRADTEATDEQWLTPLTPSAPEDWWETGSAESVPRFLTADHCLARSGRTSTQAWNWWEDTPGVLYVASKDGRQALLGDVDPSRGEIYVALAPGGVIRGTIVDFHTLDFLENGTNEYTASVWVVARRGHLVRKGRIASDGSFEIDALPPGLWDISLHGEHIYEKNPRARRARVPTGTDDLTLRVR